MRLEPRKRTAVKFCGITNLREADLACDAGADALGVILAPSSRRVNLPMANRIGNLAGRSRVVVAVVGDDLTFVPRLQEWGLCIQFCAPIEAERALSLTRGSPYLRVVHLSPTEETRVDIAFAAGEIPLFDTANRHRLGGTGRTFLWERIAGIAAHRAVVVAGGLNAGNVGTCIRKVRPFAVDVRSGIETGQKKSIAKMRAFVEAVREADATVYAA